MHVCLCLSQIRIDFEMQVTLRTLTFETLKEMKIQSQLSQHVNNFFSDLDVLVFLSTE